MSFRGQVRRLERFGIFGNRQFEIKRLDSVWLLQALDVTEWVTFELLQELSFQLQFRRYRAIQHATLKPGDINSSNSRFGSEEPVAACPD